MTPASNQQQQHHQHPPRNTNTTPPSSVKTNSHLQTPKLSPSSNGAIEHQNKNSDALPSLRSLKLDLPTNLSMPSLPDANIGLTDKQKSNPHH
ncbi:hypothetical protein HYPBUDRAFT_153589 [Hyphopichia burtonii NRRL Y-1933]|uniref:Uncharacterized protein n=1 Tax=Hyphopichia burtonii NRRL Y-1933 TaxID=984485 RepID=A0A1E4RFQ7_9ASCO|nr:hypothetical protein HYPBUDRAFT_153589 [Hyphopichia burtonii NRRL Y-1933]ODV66061.1 hypothetical protein HYPBUDRAFT_153589 [Hyphopichia burtonii NRRL Y-1933]